MKVAPPGVGERHEIIAGRLLAHPAVADMRFGQRAVDPVANGAALATAGDGFPAHSD